MKSSDTKLRIKEELESALHKKAGYLPCQLLEKIARVGWIRSHGMDLQDSQFQPASVDLRLGKKAYRIQCSFLPENDAVEDKLKDLVLYEVDLEAGGILEKGAIYLVPLLEELVLPKKIYGRTNPKSSTGRLDMFTRVIIDHGHRFDEIEPGYSGKMYLEIIPRSFPVRVKMGLSLNQLRLIKENPEMDDKTLKTHYKKIPILTNINGIPIDLSQVKVDGGLFISFDLRKNSIIAFKAKTNSSVIDLAKVNHYDPLDFWEPMYAKKNRLILEPESFYIMMSKEKICICPDLLAEMVAYDPNSGELRTHYAGFFDPGFGWYGEDSRVHGTHAVMEVRPHDVPFMVEDGQTICRLKFERVVEKPSRVYGKDIASNYQSQGLALSKYFKPVVFDPEG